MERKVLAQCDMCKSVREYEEDTPFGFEICMVCDHRDLTKITDLTVN